MQTHDATELRLSEIRILLSCWLTGIKPKSTISTFTSPKKQPTYSNSSSSYAKATKDRMKHSTHSPKYSTRPAPRPRTKSKTSNTFSSPSISPAIKNCAWKRYQPVMHKKFGIGTVKNIENKNENSYYLTVVFKCGEKRILSDFVKSL